MAQRRLGESSAGLAKTFERLSSGLRINRASDDAAGLAIATGLTSRARILGQALRNINEGVSLLSIADGALEQLKAIILRQRELAEQAANGAYSSSQRAAMDKEANELVKEYNRILASTSFNGQQVFSTSGALSLQIGPNSGDQLSLTLGGELDRLAGTGQVQMSSVLSAVSGGTSTAIADVNRDGINDVIVAPTYGSTSGYTLLGRADGTFQAPMAFTSFLIEANYESNMAVRDFDGDGILDLALAGNIDGFGIFKGNGSGNFTQIGFYTMTGERPTDVASGDFNGDGAIDLVVTNLYNSTIKVMTNNGAGVFSVTQIMTMTNPWSIAAGDINQDGRDDLVVGRSSINTFTGNSDGTFSAAATYSITNMASNVAIIDLNHDGKNDIVASGYTFPDTGGVLNLLYGTGGGAFAPTQIITSGTDASVLVPADYNNDGLTDVAVLSATRTTGEIWLGTTTGGLNRFQTLTATGIAYNGAVGDLNRDGITDFVGVGFNLVQAYISTTCSTLESPMLDLLSQSSARTALGTLQTTLDRLNAESAIVGAAQSRLSYAAANAQNQMVVHQGAAARIMDVDMAQEAAELVRLQILQNAAAAILGQANQQSSIILQLLQ